MSSASKYDIDLDLGDEGTSHRYMVELVGSNRSVLDVGCASGYLARTLAAFGNTVAGLEYDAAAAEEARPHLTDVVVADLDHADLAQLYAGRTFDVVVLGDVLEHLRDPLPTLRAVRGLLSPGGHVVISIPNVSHGDVRMSLLLGRFPYRNLGLLDTTHLRFFTRANLQELLADAGLVAADVRTTKAPLFGTELGVRPEEVDPAVVRTLEADPDATTYQFVLTAVPVGATTLAADTAWSLQETRAALTQRDGQLHAATLELDAQRGRADQLAAEVADLHARVERADSDAAQRALHADELARHADELARRADGVAAELEAVRSTRTYAARHRALRILRRG